MFFLCLGRGVTARYMEVAKASAAAKPLFSSQSNTQRDRFGGEDMLIGIMGRLEVFGSEALSMQVLMWGRKWK